MELISEQYHATMLEFLAKLNEDTLDGVYTARLTPCKLSDWNKDANIRPDTITNTVEHWLKTICGEAGSQIKKVLCFREYGDKVGIHFHFRFVTHYKTRKSIVDMFKTYWKIPKGTGKGNAAYSVRDCKTKDKTIWKNASYIAKQGDCIYHKGYSLLEVEFFCQHSAKYVKMAGKLKWEQIILFNEPNIKASLTNGTFTDTVIKSIVSWHQMKNKDMPALYAFRNIVHNISFALNKKYRTGMINNVRNEYARKNKDAGYEDGVQYCPPTASVEEPGWFG